MGVDSQREYENRKAIFMRTANGRPYKRDEGAQGRRGDYGLPRLLRRLAMTEEKRKLVKTQKNF